MLESEKIIRTNTHDCVGCNRCIRECPIETAHLTYQDENGEIKAAVNSESCIACGACLSVCEHDARYYLDDTGRFFEDLAAGEEISIIAAPSLKTNVPEWGRLLSLLRTLGARYIYDVSLGADICIWAHLNYLKAYDPPALIAQPCASVVEYCQKHRQELLEYLSPVHSPMACTAIHMRKYQGIRGRIAALSPCVAKSLEFRSIKTVNYNVTFKNLLRYIEQNGVEMPEEAGAFDHHECGFGTIFPTPGGFKENIEHFTKNKYRIDKSEGLQIYRYLDEFAKTPPDNLPRLYDVLNCSEGCNNGTGCLRDSNIFQIETQMHKMRIDAVHQSRFEYYEKLYETFGATYELSDFLREYKPVVQSAPRISEEDIQFAFMLLDKDTPAKQSFNCGACGSKSCRDMARKIALKINLPVNCVVKSRDDAWREHEENVELTRRSVEYIELIRKIGENLISVSDENEAEYVASSLQALCDTLDEDSIYVWKRIEDDGDVYFKSIYSYAKKGGTNLKTVYEHQLPEIFDELGRGNSVIRTKSDMAPHEREVFIPGNIISTLAVPAVTRDSFWGFIAINRAEEKAAEERQLAVMTSAAIIILSNLIEQELSKKLIVARELALAGTKAKSDFLSRMSHEMRTPMNAILGMTQIAQSTQDVDKLKHCVSTIGKSSNYLLGLINDVLDMSKIEAGKFELAQVSFDLERMLINISNLHAGRIEEKCQRLDMFLQGGMSLEFFGDELRLSQVVTNLLSNAIKFTPERGRISLAVTEKERLAGRSLLRFEVADTGIGMNDEQIGKLFTSFEQTHESITRRFGGTGLGLAISKTIIEKMDGNVSVQSKPGKGSVFSFEVELERGAACGAGDTRFPDGAAVLVLDEDTPSREYLCSMVEGFGVRCDAAGSLDEALGLARAAAHAGGGYDMLYIACPPCSNAINASKECAGLVKNIAFVTGFSCWNSVEKEAARAGVRLHLLSPVFPSYVRDSLNGALLGGREALENPSAAQNSADLSGVSLLLAEDIEINREVFIALMEGTGAKIAIAENGCVALEMFEANQDAYDIIIMDIQMPEMDGYEAAVAIRALGTPKAASIPIIAMTANAFTEDIAKSMECGMNGHLSKPIDIDEVIREISAHCAKARR